MLFSYLLKNSRQFYHKQTEVPNLIFGIDPGETIGYCLFENGEFRFADQTCDLDELLRLLVGFKPDVVVYEDYKIYPNKLQAHNFASPYTLKVIGIIEYICSKNKFKVVKQLATTAKGFCTDSKLKEWQFYQKAKRHANDSVRHACYYLLFGKE